MKLFGFNKQRGDTLARIADTAGGLSRSSLKLPTLGPVTDLGNVPFINASGETIPPFAVMRITTPTTVDDEMWVNVAKPDGTYRWRYLINGIESVEDTKTGVGTWLIFSDKVFYDTGDTPGFGQEWGPKSGEWKLFKNRPGFILDGRYDQDEETMLAQQMPPGEVLVKNVTGSAITAGSSGTATLYGGTALSEATLGLTVTVNNRTSVSWADTKYGMADLVNGQAYVSPQQT